LDGPREPTEGVVQDARTHVRVVAGDAHPVFRAGLAAVLASSNRLECVATCGTAGETIRAVTELRPDVALVDLQLPDRRGVSVVSLLGRHEPSIRIIVLTADRDGSSIYSAFAAGAAGYMSKNVAEDELIDAIWSAANGDTVISSDLHRDLAAEIRLHAAAAEVALTAREREILGLVAQGYSSPQIGHQLFVSVPTVKSHLANVYEKLGVSNRAAAVAQALRRGLVDDPVPGHG
jgi:two-component system, NarL family, nitrate/nitrite response regulator NarL